MLNFKGIGFLFNNLIIFLLSAMIIKHRVLEVDLSVFIGDCLDNDLIIVTSKCSLRLNKWTVLQAAS